MLAMAMESKSGQMAENTRVIGEIMSGQAEENLFMLKEMNIMVRYFFKCFLFKLTLQIGNWEND